MGTPVLHTVCKFWFGTCTLVCFILTWAGCMVLRYIVPGTLQQKEARVCTLCHYTFRYMIMLPCPWIRLKVPPAEEWRRILGRDRVFVALNHTSFMDSVLFVACVPGDVLYRYRTLMKKELLELPLLGGISACAGHFPVHFLTPREEEFSVDKMIMAGVMELVRAHVARGGCLSIFPEGRVNRSPDTLLPFRNSSLAIAADEGMAVATMTQLGNAACWPRASAMGGVPCAIRVRLTEVAPHAHGLDAAALRDRAQAAMQKDLDAMNAEAAAAAKGAKAVK
ncbi:acyltransferase-like protein, copy 2 [Tribonema minus]|uniref:Acyltransferase-like protein, copy 2 n=1 Tax=Tribonema minus TaxID=303371 RepID=A0A835Z6S5_9STRA|nr:acyltransferase-like protein, copy 2 [Tribonema minus]